MNVSTFDIILQVSSYLCYLKIVFPFFFFCSAWVISTTLSSRLLLLSSVLYNLLLIPCRVFLISVIVFFTSVCFFFLFSLCWKSYCAPSLLGSSWVPSWLSAGLGSCMAFCRAQGALGWCQSARGRGRFIALLPVHGTPLQYSCLENPMDGGAWWAAVHGVAKSRTRLSGFTFTFQFHFSLSCIGEGNGNPLQCSCLENPRDGGAWWDAVYGVA